jgi:hypothetical protein
MPETDYRRMVEEAREAAALRLRRGQRPPGGVARAPGRQEGQLSQLIEDTFIPKTPLDWATFALPGGIPMRTGLRAAALGLGAALTPSEAKGGPLTAARRALAKPAVQPSAFDRPLFDYSRMREVPNVPQFDLSRAVPARGVPERTTSIDTPENVARVNAIVRRGMEKGGPEWYYTVPLREGFVGEVGERGVPYYNKFLDYAGAVSPRSKVPQNVRTASYYQMLDELGLPFPQPVKVGSNWSLPEGLLPEGYGGLAQALHAQNAGLVREAGWPASVIPQKPKPPSFTENLRGNYQPVTIDYLDTLMLGLRDTKGKPVIKPPEGSYGFLEKLQQREAPKLGLAPAQYQASGWIEQAGGGEYSKPFLQVVEDRVKATARETGLTPEQTLRLFYRRQIPIALAGGVALPAVSGRSE